MYFDQSFEAVRSALILVLILCGFRDDLWSLETHPMADAGVHDLGSLPAWATKSPIAAL
jgi:hypothetical protein